MSIVIHTPVHFDPVECLLGLCCYNCVSLMGIVTELAALLLK